MKKRIIMLATAAVMLCACTEKQIMVDVRPVEVKSKTEHLSVDIVRSVMSSSDATLNENCTAFNKHVEQFITDLQNNVKELRIDYLADRIEAGDENEDRLFEFVVRDEVFRADYRYISLLLSVYIYKGGAHGQSELYAFNYDMEKQEFLEPDEILDFSKAGTVDEAMKRYFENPDGCFTDTPTLRLATAVNIGQDMLVFTYGPYVIGPKSCGNARVEVPWTEVEDAVIF